MTYQPELLFETDNVSTCIQLSLAMSEDLEAVQCDLNARGFFVAEMVADYRHGQWHLTIRRQPQRDLNALERTAD